MSENISDNSKLIDTKSLIKAKYLVIGEQDKFTKITEYQTSYISFKSNLVDDFLKSLSQFGIGGSIIKFTILNRQKGNANILLIEVKITYLPIPVDMVISNPRILKNLEIIFLADGISITCNKQTDHNFGVGSIAGIGYDETALLELEMDQFKTLVNSKEIEFRMTGSKGNFIEEKINDLQFARIKGFYNALFDENFELDFLIQAIKDQEIKDKNDEVEKEAKKAQKQKETSSNCFIVTATMGDLNHPIVKDFRTFRDNKLMTTQIGTYFVYFYYIIGPFFAKIIKKNTKIKLLVFNYFILPIHKKIKN
jgi:hypothetical protein